MDRPQLNSQELFLQALLTPTTLKWENTVNNSYLQQILEQAKLPDNIKKDILKNAFMLSPEYFRPVFGERASPYVPDPIRTQYISGFAPTQNMYDSFSGGQGVGEVLNNSIVLQKGGTSDQENYLPYVLRHEAAHKYTPPVSEYNNYGNIYTRGLSEFLSQYEPRDRGEEQKAEALAGYPIPDELRKKIVEGAFGY